MKREVYSWRVSADLKTRLETEARRQKRSVAAVLDEAAREWLKNRGSQTASDEAEQARLHAEAEKYIGIIKGGNPRRSELASQLVRERLLRKYGRKRSH
jgi:predicted transcriptional regulator